MLPEGAAEHIVLEVDAAFVFGHGGEDRVRQTFEPLCGSLLAFIISRLAFIVLLFVPPWRFALLG